MLVSLENDPASLFQLHNHMVHLAVTLVDKAPAEKLMISKDESAEKTAAREVLRVYLILLGRSFSFFASCSAHTKVALHMMDLAEA